MSEATSGSHTAPDDNRENHENAVVKVLGLELPLPAWGRKPIGILAIVAVPLVIFVGAYRMQKENNANEELQHIKEDLQQSKLDLKNAQDNLRSARDDYEEYVRHTREAGVEFHRDPRLTVKYYGSDGCIYVLRSTSGVWLRDPTKGTTPGQSPGEVDRGHRSDLRPVPVQTQFLSALFRVRLPLPMINSVYAAAPDQGPGRVEQQNPASRGGCLNPHPGKYVSSDGLKKGCWLQVWRRWADGCEHYQWFNTCSSYWETDPKGQPVVYWTSCKH